MNRGGEVVVVAIAACLMVVLGALYQRAIWNECRDAGHSWFYCLRMLSR